MLLLVIDGNQPTWIQIIPKSLILALYSQYVHFIWRQWFEACSYFAHPLCGCKWCFLSIGHCDTGQWASRSARGVFSTTPFRPTGSHSWGPLAETQHCERDTTKKIEVIGFLILWWMIREWCIFYWRGKVISSGLSWGRWRNVLAWAMSLAEDATRRPQMCYRQLVQWAPALNSDFTEGDVCKLKQLSETRREVTCLVFTPLMAPSIKDGLMSLDVCWKRTWEKCCASIPGS